MPPCKDPLVSLLNSWDFNALRIPRIDYVPGSVLVRSHDGAVAPWGILSDIFQLATPLSLSVGAAAEHFTGASTASYRLNLGMKLLSDWLGIAPAGLESGFRGAKRITYKIEDMRLLSTPVGELSRAISVGEPSLSFEYPPRSRLFVISEVLQAKQVVLEVQGRDGGSVVIDASAIPSAPAAAGRASFSVAGVKSGAGSLEIRFTDHHTIGFKAHEVEVAAGEYRLAVRHGSSGMSHMDQPDAESPPVVFPSEPWI